MPSGRRIHNAVVIPVCTAVVNPQLVPHRYGTRRRPYHAGRETPLLAGRQEGLAPAASLKVDAVPAYGQPGVEAAGTIDILGLFTRDAHIIAHDGDNRLAVVPIPVCVGQHDIHTLGVRIFEDRSAVVVDRYPTVRAFRSLRSKGNGRLIGVHIHVVGSHYNSLIAPFKKVVGLQPAHRPVVYVSSGGPVPLCKPVSGIHDVAPDRRIPEDDGLRIPPAATELDVAQQLPVNPVGRPVHVQMPPYLGRRVDFRLVLVADLGRCVRIDPHGTSPDIAGDDNVILRCSVGLK